MIGGGGGGGGGGEKIKIFNFYKKNNKVFGVLLHWKNLKSLHVQIQIGRLLVPVPRTLLVACK
jgi:hypothetical protein